MRIPHSVPPRSRVSWLPWICLTLTFLVGLGQAQAEEYVVYETDSSFEDVMDLVELAIQERGLYINNIMHMDEMLERTGKDLGMDEQLYTNAHSVEFCSAVLSRRMASENPARVVYCPFIVAVYTLPDDPTTYVAYRSIPESAIAGSEVMREVAEMLQGVAEGATSW